MTSPHEAPGAGSSSHRFQERMGPEPSLGGAPAGSGSRSPVPGRRAPSDRVSAAQLCTRQGRSPELGGGGDGVGRVLTNPILLPLGRDPAGHGGDLAPRRRLRRLQLPGLRPPTRRAPARPGPFRHVPGNFARPRAPSPRRAASYTLRLPPRAAVTCCARRPRRRARPSRRRLGPSRWPRPPPAKAASAPQSTGAGQPRSPRSPGPRPAPPCTLPGSSFPAQTWVRCSDKESNAGTAQLNNPELLASSETLLLELTSVWRDLKNEDWIRVPAYEDFLADFERERKMK
ncbi:glutamate receptor ionotropic, NMDA 2D-like [Bos mutus]|uniref:glutamate receptor ionotropic, NMDA 2D-like n=1 Tax=Bos mutus TaxID=72004 RepID=UPI0038B5D271